MPPEIPNYTLLRRLGEGAMAEVWLGEHKRNKRQAAIKILKPAALSDADAERLFLREGEVLAGFRHPNIVTIYDNDRVGDLAYIVMELLAEGTLLERMQRGPIRIGEALGLVVQVAGALEAAHRQQVIHRDLKPANIMLRDETTPVLTDFGAVRLLARSTIYGKDGAIVGTPVYMSPEQITGQPLTGSSDLYALGVIFHELLTGRLPYPGGSIQEIASQHLFAPIPRLPPAIAMLQPVLDQLLGKKAEERYASAQAFIDALRGVFIGDEALRQQVGFSGTSMAWSSQLRALGFVLDPLQKDEVRRAQGGFLGGRTVPLQAVPAAPSVVAAPAPASPRTMPGTAARRRWPLVATAGLVLAAALAAWLWPRPPAVETATADLAENATASPTVPTDAPVAGSASAPVSVSFREAYAARDLHSARQADLYLLGQEQKRDMAPVLAAAEVLAQQGGAALGEGRYAAAVDLYGQATAVLQREAIRVLEAVEADYARLAQEALEGNRLDETEQLLAQGKAVQAAKARWLQ